MSQFVTTGSNNTIKGDDVIIRIKISKEEGGAYFLLDGVLTVSNVLNIVDIKSGSKVQFKKGGDSPSNFNFSNDTKNYYFTINTKANLQSFEIIIKGKKKPDFGNSGVITVEIPVKDAPPETINFEVVTQEKPINIKNFSTTNYIVQQGIHNLKLMYEVEGDVEKVTLFENAKNIIDDVKGHAIEITFDDSKFSGLYEYTLQATKGSQMVSKSVMVMYVKKSTITNRLVPLNWRIINFCAAQNGDYFFALMYNQGQGKFEIYYTDQIDGSENWSSFEIADQAKMKLFATSPMLHLQSDNERNEGKPGRILFIGGGMLGKLPNSKVGELPNAKVGDEVAILDLANKNANISIHKIPEARFGHNCVLFPKDSNDNIIWLMGGEDEYGEVSNQIWTSANGIEWTEYEKDKNDWWDSRCMASATVSWKYEGGKRVKDALWLAGGFKNSAASGVVKTDVRKYQGNSWEKIEVSALGEKTKDSKALALAYGGVEETGHTGLYLLGNDGNEKYLFRLKMDNNNNYVLSSQDLKVDFNHFNQGCYITTFFRECLWVMGLYFAGASGITYSECYYRIPTIHQDTINFYNKN
jgi:hypothetical protein